MYRLELKKSEIMSHEVLHVIAKCGLQYISCNFRCNILKPFGAIGATLPSTSLWLLQPSGVANGMWTCADKSLQDSNNQWHIDLQKINPIDIHFHPFGLFSTADPPFCGMNYVTSPKIQWPNLDRQQRCSQDTTESYGGGCPRTLSDIFGTRQRHLWETRKICIINRQYCS